MVRPFTATMLAVLVMGTVCWVDGNVTPATAGTCLHQVNPAGHPAQVYPLCAVTILALVHGVSVAVAASTRSNLAVNGVRVSGWGELCCGMLCWAVSLIWLGVPDERCPGAQGGRAEVQLHPFGVIVSTALVVCGGWSWWGAVVEMKALRFVDLPPPPDHEQELPDLAAAGACDAPFAVHDRLSVASVMASLRQGGDPSSPLAPEGADLRPERDGAQSPNVAAAQNGA